MSKKINKLNAISVILMALLTQEATAGSSYADDQAQSMSGRAAMRGGSVASNNAQAATENRATNTQSQRAQQAQSDQAPALNNNNSNLIQGLIKQANFWHDKQQHDRAMQSLQRVLISDPHNEECLYLMSLWSFEVKTMRMQSSTETSSISYLLAVPISCNWIIREICSHCHLIS